MTTIERITREIDEKKRAMMRWPFEYTFVSVSGERKAVPASDAIPFIGLNDFVDIIEDSETVGTLYLNLALPDGKGAA